jgi:ABC-type branched-subunit amino acid transport system ATPase component
MSSGSAAGTFVDSSDPAYSGLKKDCGQRAMLKVQRVSKSFEALAVLQSVSLDVAQGRIVGLIGPNGSGKSTLFDVISGFQRADAGRVAFRGTRIDSWSPHRIARAGLMRTFQLSEGGQRLTALENMLAAAQNQIEANLAGAVLGLARMIRTERANLNRAKDVLALLGLTHIANEYVGNLSGGQRKLVDLGRVLMAKPTLCLLDEPTAGVNPALIEVILDALKVMQQEEGITLLIVEHNMEVVSAICETVYVLDAGVLIAQGTPESIQRDERVLTSYLGRPRAVVA